MRGTSRGWLIVEREATRLARRPSTWIIRLVLSSFVCVGLWIGWANLFDGNLRVGGSGDLGRPLYLAWLVTTWACLVLLAPLVSALAVLEEQEESTLELLALTGIRAGQLVQGKVGSRVLVLFTCVLGTLPLVSSVLSLGGVSPFEILSAVVQMLWVSALLAMIAGTLAPVMEGLLASSGAAWTWLFVAGWLPALGLAHGTTHYTHYDAHPWAMASLQPLAPTADGAGLLSVVATLPLMAVCLALQPVAVLRGTGSGMWRGRWESWLHYGVMGLSVVVLAAVGLWTWYLAAGVGQLSFAKGQVVLLTALVLGHTAALALLMSLSIEVATLRRSIAKTTERSERSATMGSNPLWWRSWATDGIRPSRAWTAAVLVLYLGLACLVAVRMPEEPEPYNLLLVLGFYGSLLVVSLTAAAVCQTDLGQGRDDLLRVTTMSGGSLALGQVLSVLARGAPMALAALGPWALQRLWLSWRNVHLTPTELWVPGPRLGDRLSNLSHALDVLPVAIWMGMVLVVFSTLGLLMGQWVRSSRVSWLLCASLVPSFLLVQVVVLMMDGCMGSQGLLSQLLLPLAHPEVWSERPHVPSHLITSTVLWGLALLVLAALLIDRWRPMPNPNAAPVSPRSRRDTPSVDV